MNMHVTAPENKKPSSEEVFKSVPCDRRPEPNVNELNFRGLGSPKKSWVYRDRNSKLLGFICRFEVEGDNGEIKKEIRPYSYLTEDRDKPKWRWKGIPSPRPLYNLDLICQNRSKTVLVCEGEKTADAASLLFPDYICTTAMFGAKSPHNADWSVLEGRNVIIVGDHDFAGKAFAKKVADLISANADVTIKIMDIEPIGKKIPSSSNFEFGSRSDCPDKYDLADALEEGWNAVSLENFIKENGKTIFKEYVRADWPFRLRGNSVEKFTEIGGEYKWIPVFSYLKVEGAAANQRSDGWSYVVTVKDRRGVLHPVLVKSADLNGRSLPDVKSKLSKHGLTFNQRHNSSEDLWSYITHAPSKIVISLAEKTGWQSDKLYATPNWIVSAEKDISVIFDDQALVEQCFKTVGSLEDWKINVASKVEQSELLVFSVSLAFVPPLLSLLDHDGFGFHLFGSSSTGKTTAMRIASSVWGSPGKYIKNWNLTSTALEGTAVMHNDTLLCLDEISQADPADVSKAAYELANGQGKGRGNVRGGVNERANWSLAFFSNGELPFDEFISGHKYNGAMAGQKARTINLSADAGHGLGVFSSVPPEFENAADFAKHLTEITNSNYGVAGRCFIEKLLDLSEEQILKLKSDARNFVDSVCEDEDDGQVRRVAQNFAIVSVVGELAISYGILPFETGRANQAAMIAFHNWLRIRGGTQSDEVIQGVAQVRSFLQSKGEERFTPMIKVGNGWQIDDASEFEKKENFSVRDRVGYSYLNESGYTVFLVFPEAWKTEVCRGRDPKLIAEELVKRGHMRPGKCANSVTRTLPGIGKARVYEITSSIMADIE